MNTNKEYEYSFRVKEAGWFKRRCKLMGPEDIHATYLDRTIYKNGSKIIARITIEENDKTQGAILDFKQDSPNEQLIKNVEESSEIKIDKANIADAKKLIKDMGYSESVRLKKKRTTYTFDGVKIEIDEYTEPEIAVVVEIEGAKKIADRMYKYIYKQELIV